VYTEFWWGNLRDRAYLVDPWCKWENNKKYLQEVECVGLDWIDLAHNRYR
jgi:hypothetical protein